MISQHNTQQPIRKLEYGEISRLHMTTVNIKTYPNVGKENITPMYVLDAAYYLHLDFASPITLEIDDCHTLNRITKNHAPNIPYSELRNMVRK